MLDNKGNYQSIKASINPFSQNPDIFFQLQIDIM